MPPPVVSAPIASEGKSHQEMCHPTPTPPCLSSCMPAPCRLSPTGLAPLHGRRSNERTDAHSASRRPSSSPYHALYIEYFWLLWKYGTLPTALRWRSGPGELKRQSGKNPHASRQLAWLAPDMTLKNCHIKKDALVTLSCTAITLVIWLLASWLDTVSLVCTSCC